jgi:GNAT superfamily N-acetyltransferase
VSYLARNPPDRVTSDFRQTGLETVSHAGLVSECIGSSQTSKMGAAALRIRRPLQQDRNGIEEMWGRCSFRTRLYRLHSPFPTLPLSYLDAVISDPDGSRVATRSATEIVGLASLLDSGKGWADLGVVIEDRWQRHGIGARLVRELFSEANARGISLVKAEVLMTNDALIRPLRRVDQELCLTWDRYTVEATLRLSNGSFAVDDGRRLVDEPSSP